MRQLRVMCFVVPSSAVTRITVLLMIIYPRQIAPNREGKAGDMEVWRYGGGVGWGDGGEKVRRTGG